MHHVLRVGLTGGIGSGKSTVCRMLAAAGVPVIDADEISHYLTGQGKRGLLLIMESFGPDVITEAGDLDRARLRNLVFNDAAARTRLENILHPLIYAEIDNRVSLLNHPYCVICIPLLVEKHLTDMVDRILVIDAPEEQQILRAVNRDHADREDIIRIMQAQTTRANRLDAADDIIHNDGDLVSLQRQVDVLIEYYNKIAADPSMAGPCD